MILQWFCGLALNQWCGASTEGRDWAALPLLWARYGQWQAVAQDERTPRADDLGGEYQGVMQRYVRLLADSADAAGKLQSGGEQVAEAAQAVAKQVKQPPLTAGCTGTLQDIQVFCYQCSIPNAVLSYQRGCRHHLYWQITFCTAGEATDRQPAAAAQLLTTQ
jgi:hypothetical protein